MEKTLHIFDFDDTLVISGAKIIVNHHDGTSKDLDSHTFATYKQQPGEEFDFSQFDLYPPDARIIPEIFQELKDAISLSGVESVVILTARGKPGPVRQFLSDSGISPVPEVVAVGDSNPLKKASYVSKRLSTHEYTIVRLFEDSMKNINAIGEVVEKQGIIFDYTKVDSSPTTLREYISELLKFKWL